jgi:hypothetical protein
VGKRGREMGEESRVGNRGKGQVWEKREGSWVGKGQGWGKG